MHFLTELENISIKHMGNAYKQSIIEEKFSDLEDIMLWKYATICAMPPVKRREAELLWHSITKIELTARQLHSIFGHRTFFG